MARAVQWMHGQQVLHTDLKHDNVWWDHAGDAGIMDLGCCVDLDHTQHSTVKTHKPPLQHWLPEEVKRKPGGKTFVQVGPSMDWFAFGIWLVELFYLVEKGQRRAPNGKASFAIRKVDEEIIPDIDNSFRN